MVRRALGRFPCFAALACAAAASCWMTGALASHPRLLLSSADARHISTNLHESPGFQRSLEHKRAALDRYFEAAPDVPAPVDPGGGYTHEQHKKNGIAIHDGGMIYQLTGESAYADGARGLLLAYARMYPQLGAHPARKEQAPGRLFWQSLNEAVWLVYAIQGYDAIHDYLSSEDRARIESDLLRPMADFLSVESPQTFDRIHNHGVWAVAAVGMTGYALGEPAYVERALRGLEGDGSAGFLKQLQQLFSPDGYYAEGPYYQRYALMPFVLFARSIEANEPHRGIFRYRDQILLKAVRACIDMSYAGLFFPLNDSIKDKGLDTVELRYGLAAAYVLTGDARLLSVAALQKSYVLTGDGFRMARAIDQGDARPYEYRSVLLRDGVQGRQGALAVLRSHSAPDHQALVLKATAQGMGHGHFDKLGWLFYDNGNGIVTDYGAARFLNVEQKNGGRYLPENATWAKQTVAHNTLTVNRRSHFDGRLKVAERFHPTLVLFDSSDAAQVAAARMEGAYERVSFERTMALLPAADGSHAIAVDVLGVTSSDENQYDLPLHFNGQIVAISHPPEPAGPGLQGLQALGSANGYQHLWLRARAQVAADEVFSLTWLVGSRFYTYSALAVADMEVLFTELGANDPHFNLRRQQAIILRVEDAANHAFVSVLEPHGEYDGAEEFTLGSRGTIADLRYQQSGPLAALTIRSEIGASRLLLLARDSGVEADHSMLVGGREHRWNGQYKLLTLEQSTEAQE